MWAHRHWLKVKRICVARFSKTIHISLSCLSECPFRPLPSCRFIAYLFSVTTLSVIDLVGEEQIKPLCLCSLEWNVRLLGQSDSTHRL